MSYRLHFVGEPPTLDLKFIFPAHDWAGLTLTTPDLKRVGRPSFSAEFQAVIKQLWLSLYSLEVPFSPGNLFNFNFFGCTSPPSGLNKKG